MKLVLGVRSNERATLPGLRLKNMLVERTPAAPDEIALISRPGLTADIAPGSGPINGIFAQEGTFSGDLFTVSDTTLYRVTSSLGAVTTASGSDVSFAASDTELLVNFGDDIHHYDGATLSTVTFPDSAEVRKVLILGGYFIALRRFSTGRFYWSNLLDGTTWDTLDFANAESAPDGILDALIVNDEIWFFGQSSIESWAQTGNSAAPFARIQARLFQRGTAVSGCAVVLDNAPFFIGDDNIVYRIGNNPERISDHFIEQAIEASTLTALFLYTIEQGGHSLLAVQTSSGTFVYDNATRIWTEFGSDTGVGWDIRCSVLIDRTMYLGSSVGDQVYIYDSATYDDDGTNFDKIWRAYMPTRENVLVDNLNLDTNVGETPVSSGDGEDPVVAMRYSQDNGNTFTAFDTSETLGEQGATRKWVEWRRLGQHEPPSTIFEFKVDAPVPVRCSGAYINERPGGGGRAV